MCNKIVDLVELNTKHQTPNTWNLQPAQIGKSGERRKSQKKTGRQRHRVGVYSMCVLSLQNVSLSPTCDIQQYSTRLKRNRK